MPTIHHAQAQPTDAPEIMAHRGASGVLPEHTAQAYQLALDQGADVLEIDLVATADGVLIARHDLTLDQTTNVADIFGAARMATKIVDGHAETGYFVEDFTLAEIATLKAVQPNGDRDPSFNGLYDIVTFDDIIALVDAHEAATGQKVSIFPELKHLTFHRQSGVDIEQLFVNTLIASGFTDPSRTKVQAFEIESLIRVSGLLDAAGLGGIGVIQTMGKTRSTADPTKPFEVPFDVHFNVAQGNDLSLIYGQAILDALEQPMSAQTTWHDFSTPAVLEALRDTYMDGVLFWMRDLVLRTRLENPVDANGDGHPELRYALTGEISTLNADARALGLETYVFTPKDEERFQSLDWRGVIQTPTQEIALLAALGLDGVVVDFVDTAIAARAQPTEATLVVGTAGDETLVGSGSDELISSGAGRDRVFDGKGADVVFLGAGNDYVRVGGGVDHFDGGAGRDYISYYSASNGITADLQANTISGSWAVNDTIANFESIAGSRTGDDTIYGTSGGNTLRTYGGDDRVYDRGGNDTVELGSGNDYVRVGGGVYSFDGGSGRDYISYYDSSNGIRIDLRDDEVSGSWAVNDIISDFEGASGSNTGNDTMLGTNGANTLRGYGGNDKLYGRSGADKLYGGADEDFLDGGGGSGTDLLYGGSGADRFHFDRGEGVDIVMDFENNIDRIELDNFSLTKAQALDLASQVGDDVVFDFGADGMLTIENATISQIENDLFMV